MWPDRTGGIPSFATESFRPWTGDTTARHIGGVSGWAYWLGWFPVAPINVILTASYLAFLFKFSQGHLIDPVGNGRRDHPGGARTTALGHVQHDHEGGTEEDAEGQCGEHQPHGVHGFTITSPRPCSARCDADRPEVPAVG